MRGVFLDRDFDSTWAPISINFAHVNDHGAPTVLEDNQLNHLMGRPFLEGLKFLSNLFCIVAPMFSKLYFCVKAQNIQNSELYKKKCIKIVLTLDFWGLARAGRFSVQGL